MSRPTIFTEELGAEICERVSQHGSLRRVCRDFDMPTDNRVRLWVVENPEFGKAYARAKALGIDALVEETLDIADDVSNDFIQADGGDKFNAEHVQRSKIRIETRRWLAERLEPRKYGARTGVDLTSSDGSMTADAGMRAARVAELLRTAQDRKTLDE